MQTQFDEKEYGADVRITGRPEEQNLIVPFIEGKRVSYLSDHPVWLVTARLPYDVRDFRIEQIQIFGVDCVFEELRMQTLRVKIFVPIEHDAIKERTAKEVLEEVIKQLFAKSEQRSPDDIIVKLWESK